ncbi:MAG TPA: undecaprenyl-diphosphate phosphatase [Gammaproteobacteria bacterium]|nr:undecaprenyl-diphosphate phosphatase [Gammaproteobacteria bacterium]
MDLLLLVKAFVLGIVEGLTEFLPISSTGHLIIAGDLLNFNDEVGKVFEIVIQLGAILAVCWEYRERIGRVSRGLTRDPQAQSFVINLAVAFLPAAILGLIFIKAIKAHLFQPFTVAIAFILGGLVIFWVEKRAFTPRIHSVDQMSWRDALKIGFAQAFSLIPGTSRSGATIMGGMIFGLSRTAATEFSFFLAIPTMFAATFYDLFKHRGLLHAHDLEVFAVGFVTAFISAFFAVKALLKYISHHSFAVFAWYRIVFGVLLLVYYRAELFQALS